jgi:TonB family protein
MQAKIVIFLVFFFVFCGCFSLSIGAQIDTNIINNNSVEADSIYTLTDVPPLFDGCNDALISAKQRLACSQNELAAFIAKNIQYPDSAKAKNIEGIVLVRFVVDAQGNVSQTELRRDIGDGCGREALRIIRLMPTFTPAENKGQPVACYLTLPIRFAAVQETEFGSEAEYSLHWGNIYENKITAATFQSLLSESLEVRDHYGNTYPIRNIELTLVDGFEVKTEKAYATTRPSSRMRRKFKKVHAGTTAVLTIQAEKAAGHERFTLMREYEIIKP